VATNSVGNSASVRVVVFDFDGVILESGDIKTDAFVELFAEHREHLPAIRAHHLGNLGVSRFKKFEWIYTNLLRLPFDDTIRAELGDKFSALVFKKVCEAPFVPGAREALEAIARSEPKVPMIVASGTPQEELDRIVDVRGLRPFFAEVYGTPNEKADVLRRVMARYECAAEDVLFIGDGTSDHDAARAAGVKFLARRTPDLAPYWVKCGATCVDDLRGLERHVA
jgi:phosphoglycolate phosphatase-like HAD superfamily hydrolase